MIEANYRCPKCGSYDTYYISFGHDDFDEIECLRCGYIFLTSDKNTSKIPCR